MDNNQNNRADPKKNPFNQVDEANSSSLLGQYDEFGNKINTPSSPNVTSVVESPKPPTSEVIPLSSNPLDIPQTIEQIKEEERRDVPTENQQSVSEVIHQDISIVSPQAHSQDSEETSTQQPKSSLHDLGQQTLPKQPSKPVILHKLKPNKAVVAAFVVIVLVGAIIAAMVIFYGSAKPLASANSQMSTTDIIKRVATLVQLPVDEAPSQIANISNLDKISSNTFFKNSKNGDLVLVYQKSGMAVIYRPSTGKLVTIGTYGNAQQAVAGASTNNSEVSPSATPSSSEIPAVLTPSPIQESASSSSSLNQ